MIDKLIPTIALFALTIASAIALYPDLSEFYEVPKDSIAKQPPPEQKPIVEQKQTRVQEPPKEQTPTRQQEQTREPEHAREREQRKEQKRASPRSEGGFSFMSLTHDQQLEFMSKLHDGQGLTNCSVCSACMTARTESKACSATNGHTYILHPRRKGQDPDKVSVNEERLIKLVRNANGGDPEEKAMNRFLAKAVLKVLDFSDSAPAPPPRIPPTVRLHLDRFSMTVLTKSQQIRLSTAVADGEALTDCRLCNTCGTERTPARGCTDTDGMTYIFGVKDKQVAQQLSGPIDKDSLPVKSKTCIIFRREDFSLYCTLVSVVEALHSRE